MIDDQEGSSLTFVLPNVTFGVKCRWVWICRFRLPQLQPVIGFEQGGGRAVPVTAKTAVRVVEVEQQIECKHAGSPLGGYCTTFLPAAVALSNRRYRSSDRRAASSGSFSTSCMV